MFRFADKGVVLWPVDLRQADAEGNVETVTVHFAYRLLTRSELREREKLGLERIRASMGGQAAPSTADDLIALLDTTVQREAGDIDLLLDRVSDWRGIADGDAPVPFTRERFAAMLEYDVYYKPIMAGLHEASRSGPAKNSQPGSAGAPALAQA